MLETSDDLAAGLNEDMVDANEDCSVAGIINIVMISLLLLSQVIDPRAYNVPGPIEFIQTTSGPKQSCTFYT